MLVALLSASGCVQSPATDRDDGHFLTPTEVAVTDSAAAAGSQMHVHDYWGNETERVLFHKIFQQLVGDDPFGTSYAYFAPPDGAIVAAGSRWMNFTSRWSSDSPTLRGVEFGFRAANGDIGWVPMPREGTASLDLSEEMNDPPHPPRSRWMFRVGTDGGPSVIDLDVTVSIARDGSPLPMSPPHPDSWIGRPTAELYNVSGPLFKLLGAENVVQRGDQPPRNLTRVLPVPWETTRVDVVLHYNASGPGAIGLSPLMSWRGADKTPWEQERVAPEREGGPTSGTIRWAIDVEPRMWDSPYATASQWGFAFDWDGDSGSSPPRGGTEAVVASGDDRLVVAARRDSSG